MVDEARVYVIFSPGGAMGIGTDMATGGITL